MAYNADVDDALIIVDGIDDAVVAHLDSPQIGSPLQLDASVRPWVGGKGLDAENDT